MKTICTQCGSNEVYIEVPKEEKLPGTQTMDEFAKRINKLVPAIYIPTTMRCKKCGYSVTY